MTPRPILKSFRRPEQRPRSTPHVHFPPTPRLTRTFAAHSSDAYDRKPIIVSENECLLPERDERTYWEPEQGTHPIIPSHSTPRPRSNASMPIQSYFHPRAYEACEKTLLVIDEDVFYSSSDEDDNDPTSPPPLTFSSSSSSSEFSDSDASPAISSFALKMPKPKALSFLPHPKVETPSPIHSPPPPPPPPALKKRRKPTVGFEPSPRRPSLDDGCLGGF